jgi:hypothetical protein
MYHRYICVQYCRSEPLNVFLQYQITSDVSFAKKKSWINFHNSVPIYLIPNIVTLIIAPMLNISKQYFIAQLQICQSTTWPLAIDH